MRQGLCAEVIAANRAAIAHNDTPKTDLPMRRNMSERMTEKPAIRNENRGHLDCRCSLQSCRRLCVSAIKEWSQPLNPVPTRVARRWRIQSLFCSAAKP
jgi:hypothetical protein